MVYRPTDLFCLENTLSGWYCHEDGYIYEGRRNAPRLQKITAGVFNEMNGKKSLRAVADSWTKLRRGKKDTQGKARNCAEDD